MGSSCCRCGRGITRLQHRFLLLSGHIIAPSSAADGSGCRTQARCHPQCRVTSCWVKHAQHTYPRRMLKACQRRVIFETPISFQTSTSAMASSAKPLPAGEGASPSRKREGGSGEAMLSSDSLRRSRPWARTTNGGATRSRPCWTMLGGSHPGASVSRQTVRQVTRASPY